MFLKRNLTAVCMAAFCTGLFGMAAFAQEESLIRNGVTIGGVSVSGMNYEQAMNAVQKKIAELQNKTICVMVGDENVYATAGDLGLQWSNRGVIDEALNIGNSGNVIKRYKENIDTVTTPVDLPLVTDASEKMIEHFISEECKPYEGDPVEPSISADGNGGVNIVEGKDGLTINIEESVQILKDYVLNGVEKGESVALSITTEPITNADDLSSITDLLGTYTTYYGSTYDRNINVERGAELLNGYLLKPGESFSVCSHLVPFTEENGYEMAGAYENGRVVQEYGGGICQVSTTLYNALLLAEIQIDERHNHTMSVSYVPTSMDAAIAEGSMDLIFTNNLDSPIFISGYAYSGVLTFSVWGKEYRPEDRYVYYESETTSTIPDSGYPVLYASEDHWVGYFAQVQYAQAGSTAVLYKYITYNGETTMEVENYSTYEATPNAYEVGTIGATDVLLNAIYNNDLATAQLAALGTVAYTQ